MRLLYSKPELRDLSQGSRISFARQFRFMSQHELADKLGITGDNKRRTMTRYEKCERNPKDDRLKEIADILKININAIRKYDFTNPIDLCYIFLWLEELLPNYQLDFSKISFLYNEKVNYYKDFINEWNIMKTKRMKKEISYEEYVNWKLTYCIKGDTYE